MPCGNWQRVEPMKPSITAWMPFSCYLTVKGEEDLLEFAERVEYFNDCLVKSWRLKPLRIFWLAAVRKLLLCLQVEHSARVCENLEDVAAQLLLFSQDFPEMLVSLQEVLLQWLDTTKKRRVSPTNSHSKKLTIKDALIHLHRIHKGYKSLRPLWRTYSEKWQSESENPVASPPLTESANGFLAQASKASRFWFQGEYRRGKSTAQFQPVANLCAVRMVAVLSEEDFERDLISDTLGQNEILIWEPSRSAYRRSSISESVCGDWLFVKGPSGKTSKWIHKSCALYTPPHIDHPPSVGEQILCRANDGKYLYLGVVQASDVQTKIANSTDRKFRVFLSDGNVQSIRFRDMFSHPFSVEPASFGQTVLLDGLMHPVAPLSLMHPVAPLSLCTKEGTTSSGNHGNHCQFIGVASVLGDRDRGIAELSFSCIEEKGERGKLAGMIHFDRRQFCQPCVGRVLKVVESWDISFDGSSPRYEISKPYAVELDGKSHCIMIGRSTETNLPPIWLHGQCLTVEAWVQLDPNSERKKVIIVSKMMFEKKKKKKKKKKGETVPFCLGIDERDRLTFGDGHVVCEHVSIPRGSWCHLAAAYDGVQKISMYMNGKLLQVSSIGVPDDAIGVPVVIGGCLKNDSEGPVGVSLFEGKLAEVRIWTTCRSASEIQHGASGLPVHSLSKGLVGYWPLVSHDIHGCLLDIGPRKLDGTIAPARRTDSKNSKSPLSPIPHDSVVYHPAKISQLPVPAHLCCKVEALGLLLTGNCTLSASGDLVVGADGGALWSEKVRIPKSGKGIETAIHVERLADEKAEYFDLDVHLSGSNRWRLSHAQGGGRTSSDAIVIQCRSTSTSWTLGICKPTLAKSVSTGASSLSKVFQKPGGDLSMNRVKLTIQFWLDEYDSSRWTVEVSIADQCDNKDPSTLASLRAEIAHFPYDYIQIGVVSTGEMAKLIKWSLKPTAPSPKADVIAPSPRAGVENRLRSWRTTCREGPSELGIGLLREQLLNLEKHGLIRIMSHSWHSRRGIWQNTLMRAQTSGIVSQCLCMLLQSVEKLHQIWKDGHQFIARLKKQPVRGVSGLTDAMLHVEKSVCSKAFTQTWLEVGRRIYRNTLNGFRFMRFVEDEISMDMITTVKTEIAKSMNTTIEDPRLKTSWLDEVIVDLILDAACVDGSNPGSRIWDFPDGHFVYQAHLREAESRITGIIKEMKDFPLNSHLGGRMGRDEGKDKKESPFQIWDTSLGLLKLKTGGRSTCIATRARCYGGGGGKGSNETMIGMMHRDTRGEWTFVGKRHRCTDYQSYSAHLTFDSQTQLIKGQCGEQGRNITLKFQRKDTAQELSKGGRTGLMNHGNTCYQNSMIQSLKGLRYFRHALLNEPLEPQGSRDFFWEIQKLFFSLGHSCRPYLDLSEFRKHLKAPFSSKQQQDAIEFGSYLLEQINARQASSLQNNTLEDMKSNKCTNANTVKELFQGQIENRIKCQACSHERSRAETFLQLGLSFPLKYKPITDIIIIHGTHPDLLPPENFERLNEDIFAAYKDPSNLVSETSTPFQGNEKDIFAYFCVSRISRSADSAVCGHRPVTNVRIERVSPKEYNDEKRNKYEQLKFVDIVFPSPSNPDDKLSLGRLKLVITRNPKSSPITDFQIQIDKNKSGSNEARRGKKGKRAAQSQIRKYSSYEKISLDDVFRGCNLLIKYMQVIRELSLVPGRRGERAPLPPEGFILVPTPLLITTEYSCYLCYTSGGDHLPITSITITRESLRNQLSETNKVPMTESMPARPAAKGSYKTDLRLMQSMRIECIHGSGIPVTAVKIYRAPYLPPKYGGNELLDVSSTPQPPQDEGKSIQLDKTEESDSGWMDNTVWKGVENKIEVRFGNSAAIGQCHKFDASYSKQNGTLEGVVFQARPSKECAENVLKIFGLWKQKDKRQQNPCSLEFVDSKCSEFKGVWWRGKRKGQWNGIKRDSGTSKNSSSSQKQRDASPKVITDLVITKSVHRSEAREELKGMNIITERVGGGDACLNAGKKSGDRLFLGIRDLDPDQIGPKNAFQVLKDVKVIWSDLEPVPSGYTAILQTEKKEDATTNAGSEEGDGYRIAICCKFESVTVDSMGNSLPFAAVVDVCTTTRNSFGKKKGDGKLAWKIIKTCPSGLEANLNAGGKDAPPLWVCIRTSTLRVASSKLNTDGGASVGNHVNDHILSNCEFETDFGDLKIGSIVPTSSARLITGAIHENDLVVGEMRGVLYSETNVDQRKSSRWNFCGVVKYHRQPNPRAFTFTIDSGKREMQCSSVYGESVQRCNLCQDNFCFLSFNRDFSSYFKNGNPVSTQGVKGSDIESLVQNRFRLEMLSGARCPSCKTYDSTSSEPKLVSSPKYLMLHVLRFQVDIISGRREKLMQGVPLSKGLQFGRNGSIESEDSKGASSEARPTMNYILKSIVVHSGTKLSSGHYTSYYRTDQSDSDRQWCYCDDTKVTAMSWEEMTRRLSSSINDTVYILIYELDEHFVAVDVSKSKPQRTLDTSVSDKLYASFLKDEQEYITQIQSLQASEFLRQRLLAEAGAAISTSCTNHETVVNGL